MLLTFTIVGRPNVGKSTLFNRLTRTNSSIVFDKPGVTRDWHQQTGYLFGMEFNLIDTPGYSIDDSKKLDEKLKEKTQNAINMADGILFLYDAREGISFQDMSIANNLRKISKPVILLANKCEKKYVKILTHESFKLGFGEAIAISAEHSDGFSEFADAIKFKFEKKLLIAENKIHLEKNNKLKMAIIGRPNVGKSTLVNTLLEDNRVLTGSEYGLTRDPVSVMWRFENYNIELIDTAGIRRKTKINNPVESISVLKANQIIDLSQVVVLLIDIQNGLEKQDLRIAKKVIEEGRVLILAVNKIDLVDDLKKVLESINKRVELSLPQVKGIKTLNLSALNGVGIKHLLPNIIKSYKLWNTRISTSKLNRWLEDVTVKHPPPSYRGSEIKLKYITQSSSRPPTFIIFSTKAELIPDSYIRYIANNLRKEFHIPGVPIRVVIRKSINPFSTKN